MMSTPTTPMYSTHGMTGGHMTGHMMSSMAHPMPQGPPGMMQVMAPGQHMPQQPPQQKEVNTVELCKVGQETTQDIVSKTIEVFQSLKTLQLPNNVNVRLQDFQDRKAKTEEYMRNLSMFFQKLRVIYNRVEQDTAALPDTHAEELLPIEEDGIIKGKTSHMNETYKYVNEEHQELIEQLHAKNQQLKEIIDHIRTIIWEINTMFAMKKL